MKNICLIVLHGYFRQRGLLPVVATTRKRDYISFYKKSRLSSMRGGAKDASWSESKKYKWNLSCHVEGRK